MDILIKSYNRPYYLDRCLFSIEKHVINFTGKIVVLDDGTPQHFLDKIKLKYPNVIVEKSNFYEYKQRFTIKGISPEGYLIPIDFWVEAAKNASDFFLLIEDDTWFVENIDFSSTELEIRENNVVITKLYWIGNAKINASKIKFLKNNIILIKPKLYTIIPFLYYIIFYKFNRFKIRKTLRFFKINTLEKQLAYYTIYATAGAIFSKEYYSKLWKNHQNKIDESLQLFNAVKEFKKQKNNNNFAHYHKEILKTGFMSSATNQFKENYHGNIDMFIFNKLLNDAWFEDQLNTITSLPNDINSEDIISVLENDSYNRIDSNKWTLWVNDFKNEYINIGCVID